MYLNYFGLAEKPFSIAPDPAYLFMSERHKAAMAHLSYGLSQGGCFIVLTGEVGTGKTTLCRNLLKDLPDNVDVALILNANINGDELLQTISDELKITYAENASQKRLLDSINRHLLTTFAQNRQTVLIIDEAQLLSRDVLEQIRILTNLETTKHKLLQIILIGQPELNTLLGRNDLRQLAQRVTARYHLGELQLTEIEDYVNYRLGVAGCRQPLFSRQALNQLHSLTEGIPRKINVLADHSLLAAYANNQSAVESKNVKAAAKEVFFSTTSKPVKDVKKWWLPLAAAIVLVNGVLWWWFVSQQADDGSRLAQTSKQAAPVAIENQQQSFSDESDSRSDFKNVPSVKQPQNSDFVADGPLSADGSLTADGSLSAHGSLFADGSSPAHGSLEADGSLISSEDGQIGSLRPVNESELTTIFRSDDIDPGSVVISEELLDDSPPDLSNLESNGSTNGSTTILNGGQSNAGATRNRDLDSNRVRSRVTAYDINSAFGAVLDSSADITGRSLAFRNLAQAWDVSLPLPLLASACGTLSRQGIACLEVNNWQQLERYNRPSILVLQQGDQLHRVIVFALKGNDAEVLVGENVHIVSQSELRARWNNNGITFWQPGDIGQSFLQVADIRDRMPDVRRRLNRTLNAVGLETLANENTRVFDRDMSKKVFALQSLFGISADSVIGPETYLLMNELLNPSSTPVLKPRAKRV